MIKLKKIEKLKYKLSSLHGEEETKVRIGMEKGEYCYYPKLFSKNTYLVEEEIEAILTEIKRLNKELK